MSVLHRLVPVGGVLFAAAALVAPLGCAQSPATPAPVLPAEQQARLDTLRRAGAKAPLAVLPALLAGKANRDVGDAVGLVLEQQVGLDAVQSAEGLFEPPAGTSPDSLPALLAAHLRATPSGAPHTMLASFEVEGSRFVAVRTWIVDAGGALVWSDLQQSGDAAFDRLKPREPMTCCMVVAERVRALFGLAAPKGERDATGDLAQAGRLAATLAGSCAATALDRTVAFEAKPTSNEQLRLWTLAKAFRAQLQQEPVATDYALLADYVTSPDRKQIVAVHFVLCTAAGEWVAVDYQNDHHDDFNAVAPKDLGGCDEVVKRRLARLLK